LSTEINALSDYTAGQSDFVPCQATGGSGGRESVLDLVQSVLAGVAGGNTISGGTGSAEALTLQSTAHATKGRIQFGAAGALGYLDEAASAAWLGVYELELEGLALAELKLTDKLATSAAVVGWNSGAFYIKPDQAAATVSIETTTHATKGKIQFGTASALGYLDEANAFWYAAVPMGIGDTSPDAMLDIVCSAATDPALRLEAAAAQSANVMEVVNSSGSDLVVIDELGQVGAGTGSPSGQLSVEIGATSRNGLVIKGIGSQTSHFLLVENSAGTDIFRIEDDGRLYWAPTVAAAEFYMTASGNVKITMRDAGFYAQYYIQHINGQLIFDLSSASQAAVLYLDWRSNADMRVGIHRTVPAATLHVRQEGAALALPVLELEQDDTSEPFIEFDGTAAASAASSLSSWTAGNTIQGFVQVTINGTKRWVPFYDDPSS
jgi:hypothetical protein